MSEAPLPSDLVTRLREFQADTTGHMLHRAAFQQAADEIERLRAPRPIQTEVCPVCDTVHDKPLCPAPETSDEPARQLLRELSDALLCRGGTGHYCPNCDNSTYKLHQRIEQFLESPADVSEKCRYGVPVNWGKLCDHTDCEIHADPRGESR